MSPKQQQGGVFGALRALDAFPKVNEDFFQKTMSGGIITVIAYAFMLLLFLTETSEYQGQQGHGVSRHCMHVLAWLRGMHLVGSHDTMHATSAVALS